MEKTWRWFGKKDKITLTMLRQIGVEGIVTALHDVPNGEIWALEAIKSLKDYIEDGDFNSFYRALEIAIKSRNSISGFAKKIGMSRTHLYSLFKNEKEPKFSTIVKIFHELGYELEIA